MRRLRFCPAYVAGMHELLAVLRADVRRSLRESPAEDRPDGAIDRLVVCYRVIDHLSADGVIMSSLVAHDALLRTTEIATPAVEANRFGDNGRSTLASTAWRLTRTDPFGYTASVKTLRSSLRRRVNSWTQRTIDGELEPREPFAARFDAAIRNVETWDPDRLLLLDAVYDATSSLADTRESTGIESPAEKDRQPPLRRLGAVIDLNASDRVRECIPTVMLGVSRQDLDVFEDLPVDWPRFGRVVHRQRDARADLHATFVLFRPAADLPREGEQSASRD
jgi:hypothetical protein